MKHHVRDSREAQRIVGRGIGVTFTCRNDMRELSAAARRLTREELGGTLAEYALVLAGVALLAVIGTRALGGSAKRSYEQSVAAITEAIGGASSRAVCRPG